MVSVCRSFGEKFVISWWTESLECWRVRCPESRFVRSAENTINSLTVGGCSKTPPSRSVSELRHHDRTEHLLQGSTGILWDRKTLMAYMDRAKELMTSSRCSLTDSLSVNVMSSIFSEWTRSMPCITAAVQHDVASGCLGKRSRPTSMHSTSDCWPLKCLTFDLCELKRQKYNLNRFVWSKRYCF